MANKQIVVPDLGGFADVAIIDVYIKEGDEIALDDPIIALESAKAVTDIPSPFAGKITKVYVKEGDTASEGTLLADIEVAQQEKVVEKEEPIETPPVQEVEQEIKEEAPPAEELSPPPIIGATGGSYHATPALRQYARELGVELALVVGTGPHGRILKTDVQQLVKRALTQQPLQSEALPLEDFSQYGEIERVDLNRIQKISGPHLQRSWQTIPHVTQFDKADVTELEIFRKSLREELAKEGIRVSILPFIIKAVTSALKQYPTLNSSLDSAQSQIILKNYYNIGIAVDTPLGLVVPVIKNADTKGVKKLAVELATLSEKARNGRLSPSEISGASFTISSLGGIGGTNFTPIINPPEVAILGVARMVKEPTWNGKEFTPKDILPLSLSYDHRVVDGAQGVRFTTYLTSLLSDMRRVLL